MQLYLKMSNQKKNKKVFNSTEEYHFFLSNRHLLENIQPLKYLFFADNEFIVIRANIVIKSLINKREIEDAVKFASKKSMELYGKRDTEYIKKFVSERISDLPYLEDSNNKIYVPIFGRALNLIYSDECEKLLEQPYSSITSDFDTSIIDAFDTYQAALFDSFFTRLVKIKECNGVVAMYHYDYQTIYFINDEGRLDAKIPLFDRHLKHIYTHHMIERITPVIDAYFADDKNLMLNELLKNDLVSYKLLTRIKKQEDKFNARMNKKINRIK